MQYVMLPLLTEATPNYEGVIKQSMFASNIV